MVMNVFNAIRIFVGGKAVFRACTFQLADPTVSHKDEDMERVAEEYAKNG